MAARYVPTKGDHGLSEAASRLDAGRFQNEVLVAEQLLGLNGTAFTGDAAARAKVAVARQVNLQVRSADESDVTSESRGRQSVTYAKQRGARIQVDPTAQRIVDDLKRAPSGSTAVANQATW